MNRADRERRHQANLERINRVQQVVGRGDQMRVDHEGTLLERARLLSEEESAHRATEAGLAAFDRLLRVAEERSCARSREVADFLSAIWNSHPLALGTLRGVPAELGDDMLAVLDAFRHARLSLVEHVPGGPRRVQRVLAATPG